MEDSIFTKIIRGDIPCYRLYEDDKVIAFLDIKPLTPGHTLVVPKNQVDSLWDLPDDDYYALMSFTKKLAVNMQTVLDYKRIGSMVEGFEIAHAHIHLIGVDVGFRHTYMDHPKTAATPEELENMASKLSLL